MPASIAKGWIKERKVRLINPSGRRELGAWDVFEIGPQKVLGFSPWPSWDPDPSYGGLVPALPPTEFDQVWVPMRERLGGAGGPYSAIFYLPFSLIQRAPLRGAKGWEGSAIIIDLPFESPTRHRMATFT